MGMSSPVWQMRTTRTVRSRRRCQSALEPRCRGARTVWGRLPVRHVSRRGRDSGRYRRRRPVRTWNARCGRSLVRSGSCLLENSGRSRSHHPGSRSSAVRPITRSRGGRATGERARRRSHTTARRVTATGRRRRDAVDGGTWTHCRRTVVVIRRRRSSGPARYPAGGDPCRRRHCSRSGSRGVRWRRHRTRRSPHRRYSGYRTGR